MSREVSLSVIPTLDLNHWRSSSTKVMSAIGASHMRAANSVKSSKTSSGMVSSTSYCQRTLSRCFSFGGTRALTGAKDTFKLTEGNAALMTKDELQQNITTVLGRAAASSGAHCGSRPSGSVLLVSDRAHDK